MDSDGKVDEEFQEENGFVSDPSLGFLFQGLQCSLVMECLPYPSAPVLLSLSQKLVALPDAS